MSGAGPDTSEGVPPVRVVPKHPRYAEAANALRLARVDLLQVAFEVGSAELTSLLDMRLNHLVSDFSVEGDQASIEFEVNAHALTNPGAVTVWSSASRWRVTYVGASGEPVEAVYEVLARVGFMALYPYVRACIGSLASQTQLIVPPMPTVTIGSLGEPQPMDTIGRRMPYPLMVRPAS